MRNKKKCKKIIRVCRTWPSKKFNGVGLHAYYYSKYIRIPTKVFVKDIKKENKPLLLKNVSLISVNYKDVLFKTKNVNKLKLFFISLTKLFGEILMFFVLLKKIDKKNIEENILHVHSANFILSGFLISMIYKIPVVLQIGGTDIFRMERSLIHKFILKKIKNFICVNDEIYKRIKIINPSSNIINVGNSADLTLFKNEKKNKNIFISIGNLRWQKDFSTLIKAFSVFSNNNRSGVLYIFGEGPEREKLENLIKTLKLEKKVFLKGYCSQKEISDILSKSYLYIQSSVSEGLPKSLIEGVISGCPIIATNVGNCKKIADKYGICVEANDHKSLAKAMKKIFKNNELWKGFHNKCINDREIYSWENLVQKVSEFYEEILD